MSVMLLLTGCRAISPLIVFKSRSDCTPRTLGRRVVCRAVSKPAVFVQEGKHAGLSKCISLKRIKLWWGEKEFDLIFKMLFQEKPKLCWLFNLLFMLEVIAGVHCQNQGRRNTVSLSTYSHSLWHICQEEVCEWNKSIAEKVEFSLSRDPQ